MAANDETEYDRARRGGRVAVAEPRSKRDKIARLRTRMRDIKPPLTIDAVNDLLGVLKGVLDLLDDEL